MKKKLGEWKCWKSRFFHSKRPAWPDEWRRYDQLLHDIVNCVIHNIWKVAKCKISWKKIRGKSESALNLDFVAMPTDQQPNDRRDLARRPPRNYFQFPGLKYNTLWERERGGCHALEVDGVAPANELTDSNRLRKGFSLILFPSSKSRFSTKQSNIHPTRVSPWTWQIPP